MTQTKFNPMNNIVKCLRLANEESFDKHIILYRYCQHFEHIFD